MNVLIATNNKYPHYQPRVSHSHEGLRIFVYGKEKQERKETAEEKKSKEKHKEIMNDILFSTDS